LKAISISCGVLLRLGYSIRRQKHHITVTISTAGQWLLRMDFEEKLLPILDPRAQYICR
jgi:hypothetical protein